MKADKSIYRWAWHNTHLTKKISDDQRITPKESKGRLSKSGRGQRRPRRPRASLTDKISNLHLLLRVPSFARWPLKVRFFCEDVHRVWRTWCERTDGEVRADLDVVLDLEKTIDPASLEAPRLTQDKGWPRRPPPRKGGIAAVAVTYEGLKSRVEKGLLLAEPATINCVVCLRELANPASTALMCSHSSCHAISHVACLAKHFRENEATGYILPVKGNCSSCERELWWVDLVREVSLRARGAREMEQLFKAPRVMKPEVVGDRSRIEEKSLPVRTCNVSVSSGEEKMAWVENIDEDQVPDDWLEQCDDDCASTVSGLSSISEASSPTEQNRLRTLVEDSDWESAEVIE